MAGAKDIDQDALAAEWGMALEEQGAGGLDGNDDWATLGEDGLAHAGAAKGGAERILNQEEIDNLLGFSV